MRVELSESVDYAINVLHIVSITTELNYVIAFKDMFSIMDNVLFEQEFLFLTLLFPNNLHLVEPI